MRDRLIKLLRAHYPTIKGYNAISESRMSIVDAEKIADRLLYFNTFIPPYKIGTRVFVITSQTSNSKNLYIFADIITHYVVCDGYTNMCFENHIAESSHNWDRIFSHREDAENKLKEMQSNE